MVYLPYKQWKVFNVSAIQSALRHTAGDVSILYYFQVDVK